MNTWYTLAAVVLFAPVALAQPKDPPKLPSLLEKACAHCHANGKAKGKFGSVLDLDQMVKDGRIVPGKPAESGLFARLGVDKDMPPEDSPETVYRPKKEDIDEVRAWIEKLGDAPKPADPPVVSPVPVPNADARRFVSDAQVVLGIKADLDAADERDRKLYRYFTIHHLHNNPKFKDSELRLFRAAVSKLVNSLSLQNRISLPEVVAGTGDTVLRIDLRSLGWDTCHFWDVLTSFYPYGLRYDDAADNKLATAATDVYRLSGSKLPVVRGDWFAVNAARPPLYHTLLYETLLGLEGGSVTVPDRKLLSGRRAMLARDLEAYLKVPVEENIVKQKVWRAAFGESGVSSQNRMVERHDARFGAYWKSYDFFNNTGKGDLLQYPLGPVFKDNPDNDLAFVHDGGEVIFTLPNGLQAYLLVNGVGERIDAGPTEVVHDDNKISGTVAIVNGLSCMHCHAKGTKSDKQPSLTWLRDGHAVKGEARRSIDRLYPEEKKLREVLKEDQERFLAASKKATQPLLKEGDQFLEPVGFVATKMNVEDLTLETAAAELGCEKADDLKVLIGGSQDLQNLGLKPLANGKTIKRKVWEGPAPGSKNTVFQEAASALDRGTPYRVIPLYK